MTGITFVPYGTLRSKCWYVDHWVAFRLKKGFYINIMTFLSKCNILFLSEMSIDFSLVPVSLHGKGNSKNLVEYLSKNSDDVELIAKFLEYFLNVIVDMRSIDDRKIDFLIEESDEWQSLRIIFGNEIIVYITVDSDLYSCDQDILTCDQTEI
jgi:hypothetical protein